MDLIQSIMDSSSHAMFTMDCDGIITHINQQAKERFGLFNHSEFSHEAGRLEQGDIVIIVDTSIGADDGELRTEDLGTIGIHDVKVRMGDRLAAVGVYRDERIKPVYKNLRQNDTPQLHLATTFLTHSIKVDIETGKLTVTVDGAAYSISYFQAISQMVVLDGKTGIVKFWQEKGFSARKEGIGNLLRGAQFIAKGPNIELKVVGYHFIEFFEGALFEAHLQKIISGEVERFENMEYEINRYALLASLLPIKQGDTVSGVIVKFRNIEDIRTTILERNAAIKFAERRYQAVENNLLTQDGDPFDAIFGGSAAMSSVRRQAYRLAKLDCSILITGESGTGKSFLAQAIVQAQPRKGPFVKVDCSTIAPTLFESEMFGYVAGAFTGADTRGKAGFFEEANGGTIFLDEIGEIPPAVQVKLLNVIQNKEVYRVGSTKPVHVDVRILAATNRNLRAELQTGQFRQDLYYRLSAFSLELPPLRECRESIYFHINALMERIRRKYDMPEKMLSGEAFSKLLAYDWPGNIRELENVLERAVALSENDIIYVEHIRLEGDIVPMTLRERLKAEEKRIIQQTLVQCGANRSEAMSRLGLSKTVFYGKLKEHNLT